jgi:hypothetical protein
MLTIIGYGYITKIDRYSNRNKRSATKIDRCFNMWNLSFQKNTLNIK